MESAKYTPVFQENFSVRSFDIGLNARMRLSSVCSYFQEIAGKHATHLDAGYKFMHETGRVWVLSRLFINIDQLPGWNQEFTAETWPLGLERIFFRRDYRIRQGQNTLITATSYWLLIDITTRRPVIFDINKDVIKANEGMYAMTMPSSGFTPVSSEIKSLHKVVYSDIDQNHHVNNARYVEWILDCFDSEWYEKNTPAFFGIEYRHEVKAGETVELRMDEITGESRSFNIEGRIGGTGHTCIRSKLRFT